MFKIIKILLCIAFGIEDELNRNFSGDIPWCTQVLKKLFGDFSENTFCGQLRNEAR